MFTNYLDFKFASYEYLIVFYDQNMYQNNFKNLNKETHFNDETIFLWVVLWHLNTFAFRT